MAVRLLEIASPPELADRVEAAVLAAGAFDVWRSPAREGDDRRAVLRALVETGRQDVIDAAQDALAGRDGWRILILPVEAAIPKPEPDEAAAEEAEAQRKRTVRAEAREVLYNDIAKGAVVDSPYIAFVALSTVVAAAALVTSNVAVLIGAMVIAPFLGPNLAFAFGAALGDKELMQGALRAAGVGLAIALGISVVAGLGIVALAGLGFEEPKAMLVSQELLDRTDVGFGGVLIALASGACAALALTTGTSASLVGVMVAVALLPPVAALGLMSGAGRWVEAAGALSLFLANVASVNLTALAVFKWKGVEPRRWLEKRAAQQSRRRAWFVWGALLALLLTMIAVRRVLEAG